MILIFSYLGDYTTDVVIDWLKYYNYPVFRLNYSDIYESDFKIDLSNKAIYVENKKIYLNEIKAVWF
ncbi:hypothetical protein AwDysgo_09260 [Bacteroidales bacterium]|nr:hypothetical protein AwDysgo_09260 [Bacteroidales bacterium]